MSARDDARRGLELNVELAGRVLVSFIRDAVESTRTEGVCVGLSGGIDSALSTALAARALDPERVHAFKMPYKTSSADSNDDADAVAAACGIEARKVDISSMVDAYFDTHEAEASRVRRGNLMARARMAVLFDQAKEHGCLVLGTSNKTEILLGYSTIFGDNASSINPLGDLYKRQVRALAAWAGVPAQVIEKKPSADLWPGQTDENELGFDYDTADEVLYLMFDRGMSPAEVIAAGYAEEVVERIDALERGNRFKRRLMVIARLTDSAINLDREIPRD